MATRNISLTSEQDAFVAKLVDSGEYQNASEALRDALRALQQRRREDALRLKALRAQLQQGLDALDRGDYVELEAGAALHRYVDGLASSSAPPTKRTSRR
jgi:antitoxin ParD1/3/4